MVIIWSRGEWCEESRFSVAANDRGVLHGMAAFETMLAIDGVIQHEEKHRRRLLLAVDSMGLCDVSAYDFLQIGRELCEKNQCDQGRARLRLTVTAGAGSLAEKGPGAGAMAWMTAQACDVSPLSCKVVTLPWRRNERSALAGMKTTSYAENVLGLQWARAQGADEGIFFNSRDELCEACTANVFVRFDGEWHTPKLDSGCLPGVMREVLLERNPGIHESIITREMFDQAEQILLSSAVRGVTMVADCDGRILSNEKFDDLPRVV
jgi:branched-subunit amino acid aminotransferase/4-amino-4-deoxychorismate lyase